MHSSATQLYMYKVNFLPGFPLRVNSYSFYPFDFNSMVDHIEIVLIDAHLLMDAYWILTDKNVYSTWYMTCEVELRANLIIKQLVQKISALIESIIIQV